MAYNLWSDLRRLSKIVLVAAGILLFGPFKHSAWLNNIVDYQVGGIPVATLSTLISAGLFFVAWQIHQNRV